MGISAMKANAKATNGQFKLQPAVKVELLDTGYFAVLGACGHRLAVVRDVEAARWEDKIAQQDRHRKRCIYCPK